MNNELLTKQEHNLFGSTMDKYIDNPYIPIAILKGDMSAEECDSKRRLEGKLSKIAGCYWGQKYLNCTMSLEPLNLNRKSRNYSETMQSPALIKLAVPYEKTPDFSSKFPHARENDPRVELENE